MNPYLILKPLITEKTLVAQKNNCYGFLVDPRARKTQIKEAIEAAFKVKVAKIQTITYKSVSRRTGRKRLPAQTAEYKKAMVTLKPGQTITALEVKV